MDDDLIEFNADIWAFGSVRVEVTLGGSTWAERVDVGDAVHVGLRILTD